MRIISPYAKIESVTGRDNESPLQFIEHAARISHRSEDKQTTESYTRFVQSVVMDHGDWSVTEHVSASVEFMVDRGITHELVRHRIASYTQESTRFVNYERHRPPSFIYPIVGIECEHCLSGIDPIPPPGDSRVLPWGHGSEINDQCKYSEVWLTAIQSAEDDYRNLLSLGWRPQEARSVFPNSLSSKILVTANLRSWRHTFLMRTSKEAHPQMRQVMIPLLKEFQERIPLLYDDIVPESRQIDNLKKGQ